MIGDRPKTLTQIFYNLKISKINLEDFLKQGEEKNMWIFKIQGEKLSL